MDAIQALVSRRSVRKFKSDPVPREMLEAIVNAGRLAPSARNVQPCEFVVVTDSGLRAALADVNEYGKLIAQAPACIVVLSQPTKYYLEDGCAATTNLLNAAAALGLGGSCWVAGDKKPYAARIVETVGAPPSMRLVAQVVVGWPDEIPTVKKRPLAEVLHWEQFTSK